MTSTGVATNPDGRECDDDLLGEQAEETEPRLPPEKVLAPFLKTLKKRRKVQADEINEECQEFYLSRKPLELLANLEDSFADPIKLSTLLNETAELLRVVTGSKSVNLYVTDYEDGVITLCPRFLQKNPGFRASYKIGPGMTLASYVAYSKEYVITSDLLGDSRFPQGIPGVDRTAKAALCLPVLSNGDGKCIAVVELYRDFRQPSYDTVNLQICIALCGWVGVGVQQNKAQLSLVRDLEVHRYLLSITQMYYENILTFNKVISDIVIFSKASTKADKVMFFLMDQPVPFGSEEIIHAEVYEEALDPHLGYAVYAKKKKASFVHMKPGVAGYCARTGDVILIKNAYEDHRFSAEFDPPTYRTRSILAVPVKNVRGVIAVLTLRNKLSYPTHFLDSDVKILELFCQYAALICEFHDLTVVNRNEELRLQITRDLLCEHSKPSAEDYRSLKALPVLNTQQMPTGFFRFDWSSQLYEDEIPKYVLYAFFNSDLVDSSNFDLNNFISFVLSVRKAYRQVPYHNFLHAFTVFHFLFNVMTRNKDKFTQNEVIAVLIAGLCHDVDHRGFTNSFVELQNEAISELYGDFPNEEHHYNFCLLLLRANDILSTMSEEDENEVLSILHRLILATNLAFFFRSKREVVTLLNDDAVDWKSAAHRSLLIQFLMTAAEHSANFKSFESLRRNVDSYYRELFAQGDLEKTMGFLPTGIMNRSLAPQIPDYHLNLISIIVEPCLEIIVKLFPNCSELLDLCREGVERWKELIALRGVEVWKPEESYPKDKRYRGTRNTIASTMSSGKSIQSDQKSAKD